MTKLKHLRPLLLMLLLWYGPGNSAEACFACWAGYGPGEERLNKPLADLRIIYEEKGREALPYIREALRSSTDCLVIKRAARYIVALNDRDSIPLLEDTLSLLVKRVAFSTFGIGTSGYQGRLAIAHALARFGPSNMGDRIWKKYEDLDLNRKSEVPAILNALGDPKLTERLLKILNLEEDHQLMVGALNVLAAGGTVKALPFLRSKVAEWGEKAREARANPNPAGPVLHYSVLEVKAKKAIYAIEERTT